MKVPLGKLVATSGALSLGELPLKRMIQRHSSGDWGDISGDDRMRNDYALAKGLRLFSVYNVSPGRVAWVITEADRSTTTVMLPEERWTG